MEKMAFWVFLIPVIYAAFFMAAFVGYAIWDRRRRRTRNPFGKNVRLMRMPGEFVWRNVIEKDASEMQWALGLMFLPVVAGGVALQIVAFLFGKSWTGLLVALVVFICVVPFCVYWLVARLNDREDKYLGFFGERYVADCLEPLKDKGWFIFHDMQCDGATSKFNLDHVAVGPGGLWIVETKTWRKRQARSGMNPHKVRFDGYKIIWPWKDDWDSVKQAARNAEWLQDWLQKQTEKKFDVSVVVAVPGYDVEVTGKVGVRVAEPGKLQDVLIGLGKTVLGPEDIKEIRLRLAGKCRDVEY